MDKYKKIKPSKKNRVKALTNKEEDYVQVFKEVATKAYEMPYSPDVVVRKGVEILKKYILESNSKKKEAIDEDLAKKIIEYNKLASLDTHTHALNSIERDMRGMALEMMSQLSQQYEVDAPQDKAYIQIAVNAFCRYLSNMNEYESWKKPKYLSNQRATFLSILSKDSDRALRQYHTILQYFEAKKNPPLTLKVTAKTAFIAQNQQNVANNQDQNEINDTK